MKFISWDPKSLQEIENFERSKVREIESTLIAYSFIGGKIGTGISLRDIEVRVIESHLYTHLPFLVFSADQ
jgi:hypothetical protein